MLVAAAVPAVVLGRWVDRRLTALEDEVLSSARARGELERLFIREHPYVVAVAEAERILGEGGDAR